MDNTTSKDKINWISILQGWSMLLVVIGHITLTNIFNDPSTPISTYIEKLIYRFHMPLFMFISGMLFYLTKLSRVKDYMPTVKDKARRLLVPYLVFSISTLFIKLLFSSVVKNPVDSSVQSILNILIYPTRNPLGEMWFIATLFILFLFLPLYQWGIKNGKRSIVLLCLAVLLNIYSPNNIYLLGISLVSHYFVYFYAGILFFRYNMINYLNSINAFLLILFVFIVLNIYIPPTLIASFTGIMFSIVLSLQLSRYMPGIFSSYRDYTFQIFLLGIFVQMMIRYLYIKTQFEYSYPLFYISSIIIGLYIPVGIARIIQKTQNNTLKLCFGI